MSILVCWNGSPYLSLIAFFTRSWNAKCWPSEGKNATLNSARVSQYSLNQTPSREPSVHRELDAFQQTIEVEWFWKKVADSKVV